MVKLMIDHGRVSCPARGDVDVEQCLMCSDFRSIQHTQTGEEVVCSGGRTGSGTGSWLEIVGF